MPRNMKFESDLNLLSLLLTRHYDDNLFGDIGISDEQVDFIFGNSEGKRCVVNHDDVKKFIDWFDVALIEDARVYLSELDESLDNDCYDVID